MTDSRSNSVSDFNFEEPAKSGNGDKNRILLKVAGGAAAVSALFLVIFLPIYFTVIEPGKDDDMGPIVIVDAQRVDCYPDDVNATPELCEKRGCTWSLSENENAPKCVYTGPKSYSLQESIGDSVHGIESTLKASPDSMDHFGTPFPELTVETTYISAATLRIKIFPKGEPRFEVPMDHPAAINKPPDALYKAEHVNINGTNFGVRVQRAASSKILFDTSVGELMFADQFLQVTTMVASDYVYGFGEHMHQAFKHDMNWKTFGMFSRDQFVGENVNLYGVHPYFMCMEGDGNAYGVYFVNSNAMDVTLQPSPAVTYRSIGGILDFYVFLGPTPEQVTGQYTDVIGRPYLTPYWSLGFQLCRYGYESLDNLKKVFNRNVGKIPYEIQYSDIDYMERQLDFTIDPVAYDGLEDFVREVKNTHGMKYIIILDPAISGNETDGTYPPFENGVRDGVFIKAADGEIAWGKVWPDYPGVEVDGSKDWEYQTEHYRAFAAFPDFSRTETEQWWTNLTVDFHKRIEFDGLWIDMNEPASFVAGSPSGCPASSKYDNPPYLPRLASNVIYDKTICMQSRQLNPATNSDTDHYNMHSLFGKSQGLPTLNACRKSTGERCVVISRSTYPGSGKHAGHWLGDNTSKWEHLRTSIIGMLEFNLFGIPYVGADVCGFFGDTNEELCLRWMQLGAFYPFDRNHNGLGNADQDPGFFGEEFLKHSKAVLDTRYTLMPYLYTLFYDAHTTGATVVRPLMNQFPNDTKTYEIDRQFLWGSALLVTPVLDEGATSVSAYLPRGRWYNYYNGMELPVSGDTIIFSAPMEYIVLHLSGGNILPTQEPALTTSESRKNPFGVIAALDSDGKATGKLFWDDGTSIGTLENMEYTIVDFDCGSDHLTGMPKHTSPSAGDMKLATVRVLGLSDTVTTVLVDGSVHGDFVHNATTKELKINGLDIDLTENFEINWEINNKWNRVDCFPENAEATKEDCEERGCTWDDSNGDTVVNCIYAGPSVYALDGMTDTTDSDITNALRGTSTTMAHFGSHFTKLTVKTTYVSGTTLRVKIYPEEARFEVPMDHPAGVNKPADALYSVEHVTEGGKFGVKVERLSTSRVLFDTSVGELMFADQFLQITAKVASEYVYGFGEHMHLNFKHDMNWKTFGMFARDQGVGANVNLYGVHPYFMCMEGDGNAYGVYFVNSNAMEVTLQPNPAVTYRSVGGLFDFYIFLGPSPEQVTSQYTELIGRPYFPPYWSLGFQLCRYGYNSLENLKTVFDRNIGKIPYDIQYSDIDYMKRQLDFTIDPVAYDGLEDFVRQVKTNHSMRYIIILDPAISGNETDFYAPFENGVSKEVFIKTSAGDIAWGKVWPDLPGVFVNTSKDWDYQTKNYRAYAAFPDFYLSATETWWTNLTVDFHDRIEFDGLWIDMNEPASFVAGSPDGCPENKYDNPPYVPRLASNGIYDKTLCMQSQQYDPTTKKSTAHYNMHNLFGLSQSLPTLNACRKSTGERCIVISRSTFPGSGKYVGHWLGDNTSKWEYLRTSIIGMLEFNLFGIPYVGADVCGFFDDTTEELCLRWMQLGAFYPFDRNHNGIGWADQDPGFFGEQFLKDSKKVLDMRYTLLPHLYTLFYESHTTGATVVRPLMNQFPGDRKTYEIDRQFLWGPATLVTAVLDQGMTSVDGYFPEGRWFDYWNGQEMASTGTVTLNTPRDHINVHIYGGHVIPTQEPALTTFDSRKNPFGLIVALDGEGKASGNLFWDDGTSIDTIEDMDYTLVEFSCASNTLSSAVKHTNLPAGDMKLATIRVLGAPMTVTRVVVNSMDHADFTQSTTTKELKIDKLDLSLNTFFEIRWEINDAWNRIDCMPSKAKDPDESGCTTHACSWDDEADGVTSPKCYYADDAGPLPSYQTTTTRAGVAGTYTLTRNDATSQRYGTPVETLELKIEYQTNNRLHFKIRDLSNSSFEIPPSMHKFPTGETSDEASALYSVTINNDPFGIVVKRKSSGKILFDSSVGPLVYEEKYLEISTQLPSDLVFGLGEHNHRRYRHDLNGKRWAIFTRDVAPIDEWNFYGHQTFYMAVDDVDAGTAVGVYLHNSNAMDVTFSPDPALSYRMIGGVMDFYLFVGDTQENVVQEYHKLIGNPVMPPYWGLGFQLSRWGYKSLDEVRQVYEDTRAAGIPYDVQYGDIDYMEDYKSFTYDKDLYKGLPDFVNELHDNGMRYVIILDPGIKIEDGYKAYDEGIAADIYVKNPAGQPLVTEVWPGETHHPDYTHPNASRWWREQCEHFYKDQNVTYDALWVDMNEPANFQPDNPDKLKSMNCSDEYNKPPYLPNILGYWVGLHDKTICMENQQYAGKHYDVHSLYGHTMSTATFDTLEQMMPDKRSFVITRSNFAGTGKYAGHWLGDNQSRWRQMAWPIPAMFEYNLFGFAYIGADVCGFWFNATAEMCQRWMQVGAFYPFCRNHNGAGMNAQHPTAFGEEVANSSREVLEIRYDILPYMYTLHHQASENGGTVVRALVHEFPSDRSTWDADRQYLLGSGFLITPVMEEGAVTVTGYFPGAARWYDYRTGTEITPSGRFVTLNAPLDYINLHVRGGTIIPKQNHAVTTTLARKNPMSLLVPLNLLHSAAGTLYWDDGEARDVGENYLHLDFNCTASTLTITNAHASTESFDISALYFEKIVVYGVKENSIAGVTVDASSEGSGEDPVEFDYDESTHVLEINNLDLKINSSHEISWS